VTETTLDSRFRGNDKTGRGEDKSELAAALRASG